MKPGVVSKKLVNGKLVLERKMVGTHEVLMLTHEFCVSCGICANVCPQEAARLSQITISDGRLVKKASADLLS